MIVFECFLFEPVKFRLYFIKSCTLLKYIDVVLFLLFIWLMMFQFEFETLQEQKGRSKIDWVEVRQRNIYILLFLLHIFWIVKHYRQILQFWHLSPFHLPILYAYFFRKLVNRHVLHHTRQNLHQIIRKIFWTFRKKSICHWSKHCGWNGAYWISHR